jgi:MtN3 and saliva related transmembrane protein
MNFDITIIGYIAGACTALAQFPQAYKVIKTGETTGISVTMYSIMTLGIFFWFLYGVVIPDMPMILANGTCLLPSLYMLYKTIVNNRKAKV